MDAIKTWYDGNWFESLLEARWAVFFDHAGIPYEYEYMGHKVGELGTTWYLPDFYLPEQRCWVEIKPYAEFKAFDVKKMTSFSEAIWESGEVAADVGGKTYMRWFYVFVGSPYFNGTKHSYRVFFPTYPRHELKELNMRWIDCPICNRLSVGEGFHKVLDVDNKVVEEYVMCNYCSIDDRREGESKTRGQYKAWCDLDVHTNRPGYILGSRRLMRAYSAARQFKAPRKRN